MYQLYPRFNLDTLKPLSDGLVCLDMINSQLVKHDSLTIHERPVLHLQRWAFELLPSKSRFRNCVM